MRVEFVDELEAFARSAWPLLISDEANHTVLLSVVQGARHALSVGVADPALTPWCSYVAHDGGKVVAAACRSRGNWMVSKGPEAALAGIGTALRQDKDFRGIVGPERSAHAVATTCNTPLGVHTTLLLMRLEGAPNSGATPPQGHLLPLNENIDDAHWQVIVAWALAFRDEARLTDSDDHIERDMRSRLNRGTLFLWLDAEENPTCMVDASVIAPTGARIGPVYTPPQKRRRGHARAAVAAASRLLLERRVHTVFLFADAAHPASSALYRRIGFAPIGHHLHLERASTAEN